MDLKVKQSLQSAAQIPWEWAARLLPLHLLDEGAGLAFYSKAPYFQVFPGGWGATYLELKKIFSITPNSPPASIVIRWSKEGHEGDYPYQEGSFRGPRSEGLPEEIRDAHFRFVPPVSPGKKVCLLLAGWGEHGYNLRMRLAKALHEKGIGTLLLENPFHGRRVVPGRAGTPVLTVAESGYLVRAAIHEGRDLLKYFKDRKYTVGVAGFSMGGTIAAWISIRHPYPLPTTLMAAPHSPEVGILGGVLSRGIVWNRLSQLKNPEEKLRGLLRRVSLLNASPPKKGKRIILLGARSDRVIPADSIHRLHRHWPHAEIRWRTGGHISMWLFDVPAMVQAIADSFEEKRSAEN